MTELLAALPASGLPGWRPRQPVGAYPLLAHGGGGDDLLAYALIAVVVLLWFWRAARRRERLTDDQGSEEPGTRVPPEEDPV